MDNSLKMIYMLKILVLLLNFQVYQINIYNNYQ